MDLQEFCVALHPLTLSQAQKAVALLWFCDRGEPGIRLKAGKLARVIRESGLGNPNSTQLGQAIKKTKLVHSSAGGFQIKPTAKATVEGWVKSITGPQKPDIDQNTGYIPKPVWADTRFYIERTAEELNGCYQCGFYNGASVLLRRLIETLLIEAYEQLKRGAEIRQDDNYFMLKDIINRAVAPSGLPLGRDSKKALKNALTDAKTIGDRSAHNRYYMATQSDLDRLQSGIRLVVEELIQLGDLKKRN